jgi:hypothetical protein
MSILDRLPTTKTLWTLLLTDAMLPGDRGIVEWWLSVYTDAEIEYAFGRTARKFRGQVIPTPEALWNYASGVLRNERTARKTAGGAQ